MILGIVTGRVPWKRKVSFTSASNSAASGKDATPPLTWVHTSLRVSGTCACK
eukprot:CAMPEP_0171237274 /NCGR_PEP_ID=MMETSP0790-20130122/42885_1 /TAXON_ID=2925 /ORGANISM="Alexandrium catenella, Strain OF101" /LENGTH=51 /DNA_ID=CAMNT_0011703627 /DNA_START=385 /DNA_END=537 /DNA_ORIENTATION=-